MSSKLGKIVADFRTSLATKISVGGTTASLQSNLDDDGIALPDGTYFFTIDGDSSQKEHIVATNTGGNLTDIKSISRQGVQTAGVKREHRVGAAVTITDFAHIKYLNDLLDGTTDLDGSKPLKYDIDPTISDDKHLATKKYVGDAFSGVVGTASSTVSGTTKLSSDPVTPNNPVALNSEEVSATSGANKVPKANANGLIDSGFIIDNAADSGLEEGANGGTKVKVKTAGGILIDADGLSVDTAYILANSGNLSSLIAGENITACDAVAVGAADRYLLLDGSGNTGDNSKVYTNSSTYFAQSFTTGARDKTVHSINFLIYSSESSGATRTFTVSLRADDAGKPHSTVLGTGTCTYTKVYNISDYSVNFSFTSPVSVSASTKYWIVISVTPTNYVTLKSRNFGTGASVSSDAGTNWSSAGTNGYDTSISVYTVDTEAGKLYQCSALYPTSRTTGFVGFATETKNSGENTTFQVNNSFSNLTGLTAGIPYYLSDTYGAIASSPGTNSKKVGLSLSATSLLIKNDN